MKQKITENDYLLINAYLDGELTTEQEKTLAIKMENPEFRAEIDQYKNFRIQTRIWFEEKTKSAKKVDLWKDINTQISHNSYTQGGILKELFNKINSKLKFEILSPTSAAFALSLLVFGVYFVSKNSDESVIALNQVNIDASENTVAKQGNQQLNTNDNQLISNLGFYEMILNSEENQ